MSLAHEYMLLIAVATPVVALAGMNLWLYLAGERDTLLLPVMRAFPAIPMAAEAAIAAPAVEAAPAPAMQPAAEPARAKASPYRLEESTLLAA
jgi:hypothetical protein